MLSLSLKEVLTRIKNGHLSSSEVYEKCVQRAKKLKELNMFITETFSDEPDKNSHEIQPRNDDMFPGIPFAVKDNFNTQNIRTTCGSAMLKDYIPPYNATVVQKLLNHGARIIGKTNLDEFAMGSGSVDSFFGPVRNPWKYDFRRKKNPVPSELQNNRIHHVDHATDSSSSSSQKSCARNFSTSVGKSSKSGMIEHSSRHQKWSSDSDWFIAGGSSGGSAVAVATGICFGALGSDTGGSTRNPASHCGVVGLKPTYGRLSRHGLIPLANSLEVPGIFAKTVDDAAMIFNVLAGHDVLDSTTVSDQFHPVVLPDAPNVNGLTVGVPQILSPDTSEDVIDLWSKVADMFEDAGAKTVSVQLPHSSYGISTYNVLCCCEVASNMARYDGIEFGHRAKDNLSTEQMFAATRHEGFNDVVRGRILAGNYFLLKSNYSHYVMKAMQLRRLIRDDFKKVFASGVDVLLTPTALSSAPHSKWFAKQDNRTRSSEADVYTVPINLAGVPAVTVPTGLSENGLPIGLQIIGQDFKEMQMLTAAKWLEQEMNFPYLDLSFLDDINI